MADKRRGMSSVLAFFLGFILAIVILIGSVVGLVFFALNYNLDKISANKDENGEYIYINADPENGGAENVLDLINKVIDLTSDPMSLTLGKLENFAPITDSLTDSVFQSLNEYTELEYDDVKEVRFSDLGSYFQDKIMQVRPAFLTEKFAGDVPDNKIFDLLLYGKEADYVVSDGLEFAVWYDVYELSERGYVRGGDGFVLPESQLQFLTVQDDEARIYWYVDASSYAKLCYITVKDENGGYIYKPENDYLYEVGGENVSNLSGNYYYDGEERVEIEPITLGSLVDGSVTDSLNEVKISEFLENGTELTDKIVGDITLGEIIDGSVDFGSIVNSLTLDDFIDVKISESKPDPTGSVLAYLVYGVSDILSEHGFVGSDMYTHTAICHSPEGESDVCYIVTEDDEIKEVFTLADGVKTNVAATTINDINDRISGVTKHLTIGELMNVTGNKFLEAISDSTVESLPEDINKLSINQLYADDIYSVRDSGDAAVMKLAVSPDKEVGEDEIAYSSEYVYYELEREQFKLINAGTPEAGKLTAEQFEEGRYYTYGAPNATWRLMLYAGEEGEKTEMAYSVNNITSIVENVTANVQKTSMRELHNAGIMRFEDPSVLNLGVTHNGEQTTLGALPLEELVTSFIDLIRNPIIQIPDSGE